VLPDFIVIGAQKSASTFLQICLADHPQIYMPKGEVPFFESPDYESQDLGDLASLFSGRQEERLGFKRPNYLGKPEVAARIAADLPNAQLIAVLRDPLERALSAYFHYMRGGFLPVLPVEEGMTRILFDDAFRTAYPRSGEVLSFGLYAQALTRYRHFLDNGRMLLLLHEDLSVKPSYTVERAYEFLGVAPEFTPASLSRRPQRIPYNRARLQLGRANHRVLNRFNVDRTRAYRRKPSFGRSLVAGGISALDRLLELWVDNERPVLSRQLQNQLLEYYSHDVEQLQPLLERDLGHWLSI
jgi:hypothetical protein